MKKIHFLILFLGGFVVLLAIVSSSDQLLNKIFKGGSLYNQNSAIEATISTQTGKNLFLKQSKNLAVKVDPELIDLDKQIISCDANVNSLLSASPSIGGSCNGAGGKFDSIAGKYMGGQCCGALTDTKEYHGQLEKLKKYSDISDIPLNPYKTPVEIAKKWIDYDTSITLPDNKQAVFDGALKISKEGPCCCKCWHYFVNEGIAKK